MLHRKQIALSENTARKPGGTPRHTMRVSGCRLLEGEEQPTGESTNQAPRPAENTCPSPPNSHTLTGWKSAADGKW